MATEPEIREHIREKIEASKKSGISDEAIERNVWRAFALRVKIQSSPELRELGRIGKAEIGKLDQSTQPQ